MSESEHETIKKHEKQKGSNTMSLKEFPLHHTGVIAGIDTRDSDLMGKLLTIGALPHTEVELLQRYPTFVIRMGYSTFAVDEELAACISIRES
jgi:Fe2+ transport system protein FeoA